MTPKEPTNLDTLAAYAEGYAEFTVKNIGRDTPPSEAFDREEFVVVMGESRAMAALLAAKRIRRREPRFAHER